VAEVSVVLFGSRPLASVGEVFDVCPRAAGADARVAVRARRQEGLGPARSSS